MTKRVVYCPFCVGYFEDIVRHHIDNHYSKIVDYDGDGSVTKKALSLSIPYRSVTVKENHS